MKKLVLTLILFTPIFAYAADETMDGNKLLMMIESSNTKERLFSRGYVVGVIDALTFSKVVLKSNGLICIPENGPITYTQVEDITHNYLKANPNKRHFLAQILIANAINDAFPCGKK